MVKQLLSIGVVGGVAAMTACFGDPPAPTVPSGATILVTAAPGQSCQQGTYIGPLAFGSDHGYFALLPYQPVGGNCNNGGGGQDQVAQTVYAFPLAGGPLEKIGSAGETDQGGHVQLAADGSGVAYAYDVQAMMTGGAIVEPGNVTVGGSNGVEIPLGVFTEGSDIYVGTVSGAATTSGVDLTNPQFPNGGAGGLTIQRPGTIWQVGSNATPATWTPGCGALDHCLVANATSYTYVSHDLTGGAAWEIIQAPLVGSTPLKVASAPVSGNQAPLGLDVDDHQIAWSMTETCQAQMGGGQQHCPMTSCTVFDYDTTAAMPEPTTLLSTQQFACIDAKLANGYVYFAIVEVSTEDNDLIGRGIGRVSIADRSVETLDLGIVTAGYGVRRIFPIGDMLYIADPFVVASIPASALDGKHDFTP